MSTNSRHEAGEPSFYELGLNDAMMALARRAEEATAAGDLTCGSRLLQESSAAANKLRESLAKRGQLPADE